MTEVVSLGPSRAMMRAWRSVVTHYSRAAATRTFSQSTAHLVALAMCAILLMGCFPSDWILGGEDPEDRKAKDAWEKDPMAKPGTVTKSQPDEQATANTGATAYQLSFSGADPTPSDFATPNRVLAQLTSSSFTAKEVARSGSVRDTWEIKATRSGEAIEGTVFCERLVGTPGVWTTVQDMQTKKKRRVPDWSQPTWRGTLNATVDSAGTISGTVKGTFSNEDGLSRPFEWTFTGAPASK